MRGWSQGRGALDCLSAASAAVPNAHWGKGAKGEVRFHAEGKEFVVVSIGPDSRIDRIVVHYALGRKVPLVDPHALMLAFLERFGEPVARAVADRLPGDSEVTTNTAWESKACNSHVLIEDGRTNIIPLELPVLRATLIRLSTREGVTDAEKAKVKF